jgi:hypothetical protein
LQHVVPSSKACLGISNVAALNGNKVIILRWLFFSVVKQLNYDIWPHSATVGSQIWWYPHYGINKGVKTSKLPQEKGLNVRCSPVALSKKEISDGV